MSGVGRIGAVILDCPDPLALSAFYAALLGVERDDSSTSDWAAFRVSDGGPSLSFQRIENYQQPQWPAGTPPQQFHLDVVVDDLDAAHQPTLELGATALSERHVGFRVYADPVGHPFCLVT